MALNIFRKAALWTLVILCFNSSAQNIYFSDTTNKWRVINNSCGGDDHMPGVNIYYYSGDTNFNNHYYSKLSYYNHVIFVRDDTANSIVIAFAPGWPTYDTVERLLYDYNLIPGDTFSNQFASHVVSNIDSVSINGIFHRIWDLNSLTSGPFVGYRFIEGVGCINGPIYPLYPYFFEECYFESCFENNGINPPFNPAIDTFSWEWYEFGLFGLVYYDNTSSCDEDFGLSVKSSVPQKTAACVSPNPLTFDSEIVLPYVISSGQIMIVNQLGQTIQRSDFTLKKTLYIGNIVSVPGVYYYKVLDKQSNRLFTGNFSLP